MTIDQTTLDKYNKYYFKLNPRKRKPPIEKPTHPSINKWMIMNRIVMNALKQQWKDFIVWFIEDQGLTNKNIEYCSMTFTSYFRTRIRKDCDNTVPKFILDGLSESKFIVDDDWNHLHTLILKCGWDKDRQRTEILVEY